MSRSLLSLHGAGRIITKRKADGEFFSRKLIDVANEMTIKRSISLGLKVQLKILFCNRQ